MHFKLKKMELEKLRSKKSTWDFTGYEVSINKSENCIIHTLHNGGSSCGKVVFINTSGVLAVTGDFYNWIFRREFVPSKDGYVSDDYWCGKLQGASDQKGYAYDSDETEKELNRMIETECAKIGYEDNELSQMKEYYTNCLNYTENQEEYRVFAYENLPDFADCEAVVEIDKIKPQLLIIFDAFNEICKSLM